MYLFNNLKPQRFLAENEVECPVLNCTKVVPLMVKGEDLNSKKEKLGKYKCNEHGIFISPSTFEYDDYLENLLWKDADDLILLEEIFKPGVKRESRIARENSEDALTWNVFRYFDKINELAEFFSGFDNQSTNVTDFIYWSYSAKNKCVSKEIIEARIEFGESKIRGSEPDLICITDKSIFFIEAKLTAKNKTKPSNPNVAEKYINGGGKWFNNVFTSDFHSIAIKEEKYELMRFWLLGSWLANKYNKSFYLINLTPLYLETEIENQFKSLIIESDKRKFCRITWEQIYSFFSLKYLTNDEKILNDYFLNKTLGYNKKSNLRKAFFIPS